MKHGVTKHPETHSKVEVASPQAEAKLDAQGLGYQLAIWIWAAGFLCLFSQVVIDLFAGLFFRPGR